MCIGLLCIWVCLREKVRGGLCNTALGELLMNKSECCYCVIGCVCVYIYMCGREGEREHKKNWK